MENRNIKRLLILTITLCALIVPVQAAVYSASSTNLQVLANQAQWSTYQSSPLQELMFQEVRET